MPDPDTSLTSSVSWNGLPEELLKSLAPIEGWEPAGAQTTAAGSARLLKATGPAVGEPIRAILLPEAGWIHSVPPGRESLANLIACRSQEAVPPEVVPFLNASPEGETPWATGTLQPGIWLGDQTARNGRAPIPQAIQIIRLAANTLGFLHQSKCLAGPIVPAEVWAPLDGKSAQFPWAGFIGARLAACGPGHEFSTNLTPFYPPEVLDGGAWDISADLYALGCLAYWLLTGEMPYQAATAPELRDQQRARKPRTPPELRMGVPPVLSELVMRLISTEAHERPLKAQPVADRLAVLGTNAGPSVTAGDGYGVRTDQRNATPLPRPLATAIDAEIKKLQQEAEAAAANPELWLKLAQAQFKAGRAGDCLVAAEKALKLNPRMGAAALLRVDALLAKGQVKQAIRDLQPIAKALPGAPQVLLRLAKARAADGDHARAVTDCDGALKADEKNIEALTLRAKSNQALGNNARALDDLDKAIGFAEKGKPGGFARLLALRAEVHLHLNRHEEAKADIDQALATDPDSVSARQVRVHYLLAVGKPADAEKDCDHLVRQAGRMAWPWLLRARQRQMAGEYHLALEDFDEAMGIEATPSTMAQTALLLAAAPEKSVRDSARALELGRKAAEETGWEEPTILEAVAAAYAACGQGETAAGWVIKAITRAKPEDKDRLQETLKLYQAGKPYRLGKS